MVSIHASGTTVSYEIVGNGPGLVLLHGTNSDGRSSFGNIVDRLSKYRSVIIVDYAGCGSSTIPEGELSLNLLVKQVVAVILDSNVGPVDLLGFSLGAVTAAAVASERPDL